MRRQHRFFSALVASIGALLAGQAHASGTTDATVSADALFRSGKEAAARGDLAMACAQLAESERLDHAVGTLLNLADCEERRGSLASALEHFRAARDELGPDDFRVKFTDERASALARRVPRLTIRLRGPAPAGAHVLRDGLELRAASLDVAMPVDPGLHVCIVRAPGHADARIDVELHEGERKVVELAPGPLSEAGGAAPAGGSARRTAAFTVGGVGVVSLGVGVVTGLMAIGAASTYRDHCNTNGECDSTGLDAASTGRTMSVVSPASLLIGALGIGVGSYLLLTSPRADAKVSVAPRFDAHGAGVGISTSF